MTLQRTKPIGDNTQSLSRQIDQAATRLDRRKRRARVLGSVLGRRMRSEFASPAVLCIAGFAGFVIGDWIHRPMKEPPPEQTPSSPERPRTAALPNALLLLKIAQEMGTFWAKANVGPGVRQRTDESPPQEHAVDEPGR